LAARRLLERTTDGHYRAGFPLRILGAGGGRPPSFVERAPSVLEDLCAVTKRRARLGVLRDLSVAYIEHRPGPRTSPRAVRPRRCRPIRPRSAGCCWRSHRPAW